MKRHYRWASFCCAVLLLAALLCYRHLPAPTCPTPFAAPPLVQNLSNGGVAVDRSHGVVFVGGMPRSGTTLMRVMLDAHPALRCGEETRVIPRLLSMRTRWHNSKKERQRFKEAGLTDQVLDSAVAAFILEIITRHGEPAPRLCNKDPFTMKSADYLSHLFPNARFIFMVRDARATVHSIISRNVTITNFDLSNYRQCFGRWNTAVQVMYEQCQQLGAAVCLQVPYEQLVLQPRRWMLRVLSFLGLPWHEDVLHHERTINKPGGASLSKLERSSDQVVRPLNLDGFHKWVGHIPQDVLRDLASLAPMMTVLGYDPDDPAPSYGTAESPLPSHQAAPPG